MSFEPFQKFIAKASSNYGITTEAHAAHVCHSFRQLIPTLFPDNNHAPKNISPAHYKNLTLTVNITSPAWAQELIIRKDQIISEINSKFSKEVVKHLRTQLSPTKTSPPPPKSREI